MRSWKPHAGKIRAMAFSPDGATLATAGGTSGFVWLWQPTTGELKGRRAVGLGGTPALDFSPGGGYLAAPSGGRVLVWPTDPAGPDRSHELSAGSCFPNLVAFSPSDGRLVAADESSLVLWHDPIDPLPTIGTAYQVTARGPGSPPVRSIRFTPDGSRLLVGAADLEIWPPDLSAAVGFVRTNKRNGIRNIAVTRDGSRAAVVIRNTVRICSLETLKFERTLHWGSEMVYSTTFTPDGRILLTAGADATVRLWGVATGQETRRFDWGIGKVTVAAFAPDGLTCAAGGENGQIVVWDVDV